MAVALGVLAGVGHRVNGPAPAGPDRWPGNLSVRFPGVDANRLMSALPGLALGSGSACSSGSGRPSHVLAALGVPPDQVRQTLRLGWNDSMSAAMLEDALNQLCAAVRKFTAQP